MVANINQNQISGTLLAYRNSRLDVSVSSLSGTNDGQTAAVDTVSLRSESTLAVTYSGTMQLAAGDEARFDMLRSLVLNLLQEQGINTKIAVGDSTIDLAAITPEKAQELVSDDGYFGVEQTSERIFQFAVGVAGGDPARIEEIKAGIDKGFAEAKKAFGGWLPDISYDTYDAVMDKLDKWVAENTAAA
ncbi:hypothetical protein [Desulfobulbus elongatus]|uniref:hypothetical protein n=1 Tax=Desulfobulbus elongatus TaxID=53332 RepID=UPI000482F1BA|nr:hypothetical protein [Desulfobulbus elongatus]